MEVNKVQLANGEVLIDLTSDSVTPETLAEGETAHNAAGDLIMGTMKKTASDAVTVPDYWQEHIDRKIATIKALQDEGGKDCFSYVVMADMHYPSNLGKNSPKLARYIIDKIGAKYALVLGDVRTRGARGTKAECETEWEDVFEMLSPIKGNMLLTQGNHDAGYGSGDYDGDGDSDNYAYEFTPAEMFERIYRKAQNVGDVHYDNSGTAYYIDDVSNKVRYIMLNTQLNFDGNVGYSSYETVNGMAKYPSMVTFRYTQCQYDFLTEDALVTVPSDDWSVIMGSHVPINQTGEMPEFAVMVGVLEAYKNKSTYSGEYAGTAGGTTVTANFTDLCDENSADFLVGQRIDTSGNQVSANDTYAITTYIPVTFNKTTPNVLRIKGFNTANTADLRFAMFNSSKTQLGNGWITYGTTNGMSIDENGVLSWAVGTVGNYMSSSTYGSTAYVRVSMQKSTGDIIATVNEEITYTETEVSGGGFDAVSVTADFTNAKGDLISYHGGHSHKDAIDTTCWQGGALSFPIITTRCDAKEENDTTLKNQRVVGTVTEQSFDVFTVNKKERKIYATKIGAGSDRMTGYSESVHVVGGENNSL